MLCTLDAVHSFIEAKVLFAPAKAANPGGVAVSCLEQSQNVLRISWSHEEVESKLVEIIGRIHEQWIAIDDGQTSYVNYLRGANEVGFDKVAQAMLAYGAV